MATCYLVLWWWVGLPRVYILGPLLFKLYFNDIPGTKVRMFTDDTKPFLLFIVLMIILHCRVMLINYCNGFTYGCQPSEHHLREPWPANGDTTEGLRRVWDMLPQNPVKISTQGITSNQSISAKIAILILCLCMWGLKSIMWENLTHNVITWYIIQYGGTVYRDHEG